MLNSNKGNITILSLLIVISLLALTLSSLLRTIETHLNIKNRLQSYLCTKYLVTKNIKYLERISTTNWLIRLAYYNQFNPSLSSEAAIIHKALIQGQNLIHISHLKNLLSNSYCQLTQGVTFAKNLPYESHLLGFKNRNIDGTARLISKSWSTYILSGDKKIKEKFVLKTNWQIKSPYSKKILFQTKELSNLKDFYGQLSFPLF